MKGNRGIFVKLNYKNIGELNSFVYDMTNGVNKDDDKYVMCAGKYDKNGWTIVFKAKSINEAQELVTRNSQKRSRKINSSIIEKEKVSIPSWM
ncbi:hypothetical protein H8S10_01525 [Clostridium sp. NSJ-49]|jgi:predicted kinase|uniref:Uncharacterized protein n=1 Tax=Clostridium disporicum TaxID=84024 RepID=A0A174EPF7_9CLOT|nr:MULTISPECIES: hypothetical protein [Clostridium]MBC5624137.1 hypothetical protein [Clostridium sp. NSJ-49]MCD2503031.1 hypothetical protein [Clostridium sp. NSJ-145]CUO38359.1 Uncharacterised protein [Clostridium disporicum]